jgi:hypothetical protein
MEFGLIGTAGSAGRAHRAHHLALEDVGFGGSWAPIEHLQRLQQLKVTRGWYQQLLASLPALAALTSLTINSSDEPLWGWQAVAAVTQLRDLSVSGFGPLEPAVSSLQHLTRLSVTHSSADPAGLADSLRHLRHLINCLADLSLIS